MTIFEAPFGKIGLGICYDIRFPELAMIAARQGESRKPAPGDMFYMHGYLTFRMCGHDLPFRLQHYHRTTPLDSASTSTVSLTCLSSLGNDQLIARAVDNQIYVSMCSPSRNPNADYKAYGHSMVVNPLGEVLCEADENEAILYADIGESNEFFRRCRAELTST